MILVVSTKNNFPAQRFAGSQNVRSYVGDADLALLRPELTGAQRCHIQRTRQRRDHRPARRSSLPAGWNRERLQPHILDPIAAKLRRRPFRRSHVGRRSRQPPADAVRKFFLELSSRARCKSKPPADPSPVSFPTAAATTPEPESSTIPPMQLHDAEFIFPPVKKILHRRQ